MVDVETLIADKINISLCKHFDDPSSSLQYSMFTKSTKYEIIIAQY